VAKGERVRAVVLDGDEHVTAGVAEIVKCDLLRPADAARAVAGGARVYHLAGNSIPLNSARRELQAANVTATRNLLEACQRLGVGRVVHASSIAAVGYPDSEVPVDENFPYNGDSFDFAYMDTKHDAEVVVAEYVRRGLDVVLVNPSVVIAAGTDTVYGVGALIRASARGLGWFYPPGGVGVTSREEMVAGFLQAMDLGRTGQRYILNTANLPYRELMTVIARIVGRRPPFAPIPRPVLFAVGAWGSLLAKLRPSWRSQLNAVRLEHVRLLQRRCYYISRRARSELCVPESDIRTGIEEVCKWLADSSGSRMGASS
jgi:dihydroflavonol-4-reductase